MDFGPGAEMFKITNQLLYLSKYFRQEGLARGYKTYFMLSAAQKTKIPTNYEVFLLEVSQK